MVISDLSIDLARSPEREPELDDNSQTSRDSHWWRTLYKHSLCPARSALGIIETLPRIGCYAVGYRENNPGNAEVDECAVSAQALVVQEAENDDR